MTEPKFFFLLEEVTSDPWGSIVNASMSRGFTKARWSKGREGKIDLFGSCKITIDVSLAIVV